jgi:hypothetical protein
MKMFNIVQFHSHEIGWIGRSEPLLGDNNWDEDEIDHNPITIEC